jgi:undecaprenyl pyrophosphate synthase
LLGEGRSGRPIPNSTCTEAEVEMLRSLMKSSTCFSDLYETDSCYAARRSISHLTCHAIYDENRARQRIEAAFRVHEMAGVEFTNGLAHLEFSINRVLRTARKEVLSKALWVWNLAAESA